MKPVIIFKFLVAAGPGFLTDFLSLHQIPYVLVKVDTVKIRDTRSINI